MNTELIRNTLVILKKDPDWLADMCGVKSGTMGNILRGTIPAKPVVILMAMHLNCKVSDLFLEGAKPNWLQTA
jgi:hypothetical protein